MRSVANIAPLLEIAPFLEIACFLDIASTSSAGRNIRSVAKSKDARGESAARESSAHYVFRELVLDMVMVCELTTSESMRKHTHLQKIITYSSH